MFGTVDGDEIDFRDLDQIEMTRLQHGRMFFEDEKIQQELLPFYTPPSGQLKQHAYEQAMRGRFGRMKSRDQQEITKLKRTTTNEHITPPKNTSNHQSFRPQNTDMNQRQ